MNGNGFRRLDQIHRAHETGDNSEPQWPGTVVQKK